MEQISKDTTANPVPLSLFGFGMTKILLKIHDAGFFERNLMIIRRGIFLGLWKLFTLAFLIATLNSNTKGKLFFTLIIILFAVLSFVSFTVNKHIHTFVGYEGIVCSLFGFYESPASVLNEKIGKKVLPLNKQHNLLLKTIIAYYPFEIDYKFVSVPITN
jgi:succinate-acetate transporter protein